MKKILYLSFTIIVIITFIFIYLFKSSDIFDNKLRDEMFLLRGEIDTTQQIVIIDIDEKSLKKLGQWPWDREKIAQILLNLTDAGALIIGLDLFFAEKDTKSPAYLSKKYHLKINNIDFDKELAYVLSNTPTISGFYFDFEHNYTKNILPNIPAIFIEKQLKNEFLLNAKGFIGNIPILQNNTYSGGFINMIPDNDGVVRRIPLFIKYNSVLYPSLAFEMYRIATGNKKIVINYSDAGIDSIQIGKQKIKTDRFGRLFINYRGDRYKFKYISAVDIYENRFNKNDIKDKFILVGTSAGGLFDLRVTPYNNVYAGVEVHANIIDNLLKNDLLFRPDTAEIIDIFILILMGIIISFIFYFLGAIISLFLLVTIIIGYFELNYFLMFHYGYIFNIALPLFEIIILSIIFGTINYFLETKKTESLKKAFSKKVSTAVMEELLKHNSTKILEPKEKEITIFFSDIRSFTSISEKLSDPKKVIQLLNIYMTPMVENIILHKGTIDKFIGDAIMAYWNAPVSLKNHADEAVSSAIEQIKLLKKLNKELKNRFDIEIEIGIGINSGIATIGEMGSEGRADFTAIGDNVNLASRLESLNKIYHTHILISEFTFKELQKNYIIREIDLVKVKGKDKAVKIYQVIDFQNNNTNIEFKEHHKALNFYYNGDFQKALTIFQKLYNETDEKLYKVYIDRCNYLIDNPYNFSGIWEFKTK